MKVRAFLGALLGRRDWVYVLGLLVPFAVYNLALKALILSSRNVDTAGQFNVSTFSLLAYGMWSDVFFVLGYALLWIGLFAAARKGPLRWGVLVLFHATAMRFESCRARRKLTASRPNPGGRSAILATPAALWLQPRVPHEE